MARIAPEDLTTLYPASTVKVTATTAEAELEEMSVAHLINEAANCGQLCAVCSRPISTVLRTKLESQGYTLTTPQPIAKSEDETIISWEDAE